MAPLATLETFAESLERRPRTCLTVLAVLLAVQISPWFYFSPDGCVYLSLARSLAAGEPMTVLGQPRLGIPIGYPLLVSPAFWFSERPFMALSIVNWLFAVALMLGVHRWLQRQIPQAAVLLTSLIMVNAGLWFHYRRPLKEIAFLAVMVWLANGLQALLQGDGWQRILRRAAIALLLLVLLLTIRYSGIVLVAGLGLALMLKVYRDATHRRLIVGTSLVLGLCSLIVLGVLIRYGADLYLKALVPASSDIWAQIAEGLRLRISEIGRLSLPGMFKSYSGRHEWLHVNVVLYLTLLPFVAWGWWQLAWRRQDVLALTFPFYFALYVAWPFDQGARFMLPMVPVLVTCLWLGARPCFPKAKGWTVILLGMHLVGSVGYWVSVDAPRAIARHRDWGSLERLAAHTESGAERLAVRNFEPDLHAMLQFSLDRPLSGPLTGASAPGDVDWIVQPKQTAGCVGFTICAEAGGYHLLARTQPQPPTPAAEPAPAAPASAATAAAGVAGTRIQ